MTEPVAQAGEPPRPILDARLAAARAWVLGLVVDSDGTAAGPGLAPGASSTDCTCPDFCERDHENE